MPLEPNNTGPKPSAKTVGKTKTVEAEKQAPPVANVVEDIHDPRQGHVAPPDQGPRKRPHARPNG